MQVSVAGEEEDVVAEHGKGLRTGCADGGWGVGGEDWRVNQSDGMIRGVEGLTRHG